MSAGPRSGHRAEQHQRSRQLQCRVGQPLSCRNRTHASVFPEDCCSTSPGKVIANAGRLCNVPDLESAEMNKQAIRIASGMILALALLTQGACGDDESAQRVASCSGAGCSCSAGAECVCTAGQDCQTTCVECSLTCESDSKCNAQASGAVSVQCDDTSACKGNGGDGSSLTCGNSSDCDLKAGASSTAICTDSATCKINLGQGSAVTCSDTSHCDIKCDDGDCVVECTTNATCALNCGPEDSGAAVTECADGRLVCGRDC